MTARLAAVTVVLLAGCGSSETSAADTRIDRCTERLLERAESDSAEIRRYVEQTYCVRFEERGWIHEDGSLRIAAYTEGYEQACGEATVGGPAQTVPCEELSPPTLDCALLDQVRRSEVRRYLEELQRTVDVRCSDGTPLDELGAS